MIRNSLGLMVLGLLQGYKGSTCCCSLRGISSASVTVLCLTLQHYAAFFSEVFLLRLHEESR